MSDDNDVIKTNRHLINQHITVFITDDAYIKFTYIHNIQRLYTYNIIQEVRVA